MRAKQLGKTLNSRELNALIHPLRYLDNRRNFAYLAADYLTLAAVMGIAITFFEMRGQWGLDWAWNVPVYVVALLLIGAVQHRFAGLGHEGAHWILLKNRFWNEFVSDWFCMFPLFSTTAQYRLMHLGHHEYTNDWQHDPELLNMGKTRMMDQFPMTRAEFTRHFFSRIFWPPRLLRYVWDNIYTTTFGNSVNPYQKHLPRTLPGRICGFRITSLLGLAYLPVMVGVLGCLSWFGNTPQLMATTGLLLAAATAVIYALPDAWYFQSDFRPAYSSKFASVLRLTWVTLLEALLAWSRLTTGEEWGVYFWLLWVAPLLTTFPYYMLLRDLYQHANADDGKLTNSRVIFTNPIARWAMFIYGQDIHLTHHLYPAVPHYNLRKLHRLLVEHNEEYAQHVVECHGVIWPRAGKLSALDCMEIPTCEPVVVDQEALEMAEAAT
ncbi:MAG TPA: fatty acid desaturase [Pirellulales bacterium]|nr:fatty acid desaturase [Pirellulales bacterium]